MGRKKSDNPKVPLTLSVRRSTKEAIKEQHFDAASLLDSMFTKEVADLRKEINELKQQLSK